MFQNTIDFSFLQALLQLVFLEMNSLAYFCNDFKNHCQFTIHVFQTKFKLLHHKRFLKNVKK